MAQGKRRKRVLYDRLEMVDLRNRDVFVNSIIKGKCKECRGVISRKEGRR